MEKFHRKISTWQDRLDSRWKQLPPQQKRRIVMYSFCGYLLIALAIVLQAVYQVRGSEERMDVEHIRNPFEKPGEAEAGGKEIQELKIQHHEREYERESELFCQRGQRAFGH